MKSRKPAYTSILFLASLIILSVTTAPEANEPGFDEISPNLRPIQIKGVFPEMAAIAGHENPSEAGFGALLPWADRLWAIIERKPFVEVYEEGLRGTAFGRLTKKYLWLKRDMPTTSFLRDTAPIELGSQAIPAAERPVILSTLDRSDLLKFI